MQSQHLAKGKQSQKYTIMSRALQKAEWQLALLWRKKHERKLFLDIRQPRQMQTHSKVLSFSLASCKKCLCHDSLHMVRNKQDETEIWVIRVFTATNGTCIRASYSFLGPNFIICQWRSCLSVPQRVLLDIESRKDHWNCTLTWM